ncbi:MAG: sugar phosphate isomerase/epimerase [Phycisphaerales bacterium]|nr:sugar phosphate isomerase/epimerase [Phycisphaerales bacterium]
MPPNNPSEMSITDRMGVCSWSLRASGPEELADRVQACGVGLISVHLDSLRTEPDLWASLPGVLEEKGIRIGSGMWAPAGEDYSTLDTIRRTGGVRPDATWDENQRSAAADARIAAELGITLVTFHAGFLPHDPADQVRRAMIERLRIVVDIFADEGISVGFETGQETAETLLAVLDEIDRPSVGVNFDPANMLLYGMGDPIESLRLLSPRVLQVHIKDAIPSATANEWGEEVVVGTGEVDWRRFVEVLTTSRYDGDLMIEREAGDDRTSDVRQAMRVVRAAASG